jgi:hypothetical protein
MSSEQNNWIFIFVFLQTGSILYIYITGFMKTKNKASMWSSVLLGPARNGVKLANKRGRAGGRCLTGTNARPPRCPPSRRRWRRPPASCPWRCRQAWLHCLHLPLQQAHPLLPPPPRPGRCPEAVRRNALPKPRLLVHPHLQLVPTRRPIGGVPASF